MDSYGFWNMFAFIVCGMWFALLFVGIGIGIGEAHARMDSRSDKDVLSGTNHSRNCVSCGDGDRNANKIQRIEKIAKEMGIKVKTGEV